MSEGGPIEEPEPRGDEEELIEELLDRWEEQQDLSVEELCRDHPHLAGRVAERIARLRRVDWMGRSYEATTGGRYHRSKTGRAS